MGSSKRTGEGRTRKVRVLQQFLFLGGSADFGVVVMARMVKSRPIVQETWGGEDPLEKEMATHSSILAWKAPWTEAGGL